MLQVWLYEECVVVGVGAEPTKPAAGVEVQKELPPWLLQGGEKTLANSDGTGPSTTGTGTGVASGLPASMSIGTGRSEDVSDTAAAQSEAEVLVCSLPLPLHSFPVPPSFPIPGPCVLGSLCGPYLRICHRSFLAFPTKNH